MRLGLLYAFNDVSNHGVIDAESQFWLVAELHVDINCDFGVWLLTIAHRIWWGSSGFGVFPSDGRIGTPSCCPNLCNNIGIEVSLIRFHSPRL